MLSMHSLTDDNFYAYVRDGVILVDFWAAWCGPCRQTEPVLKRLNEFVSVGKVDVDSNPNLVKAFTVNSIPTLILFVDGKPVERFSGAMHYNALMERLEKWL